MVAFDIQIFLNTFFVFIDVALHNDNASLYFFYSIHFSYI